MSFQLGRESPFSIWGQHPQFGWAQSAAKVAMVLFALGVAFVPARKSPVQLAALAAAVLIALQLTLSHWFYLYIVWWFPLAAIALLARPLGVSDGPPPARSPARSRPPAPLHRIPQRSP